MAGMIPLALLLAGAVQAQQFVVDDAPVVEAGACQLEAWRGEQSTWVLPACRPLGKLELTAGVGWLEAEAGSRQTEYVVQGKYLLRPERPGGAGFSLVAGGGVAPIRQPGSRRVTDLFVYVPATVSFGEDRLLVHPNLGWLREWEDDGGEDRARDYLTWGIRGDLAVHARVSTIAEWYGAGSGAGWQAGFRVGIMPERLVLDLTYGAHLAEDDPGPGFTVGLAWTPPPWR